MSNPVPGQAPPGWYPDPSNADQQRYWNGATWTDNVAPRYIYGAPPAQPVSPPPPQGPPIVMRGPQPLGPGGQPYATFARRLSGYLIDMVVLLPVGIFVMLAVGWPSSPPGMTLIHRDASGHRGSSTCPSPPPAPTSPAKEMA